MAEPVHPNPASGSLTILVVDDDPDFLALCSTRLAEQGFTVLKASESQEALQACRQYPGRIHLLLVDLMLPPKKFQLASDKQRWPRMHGLELIQHAVAMRPKIRAILMSAHSDEELRASGLNKEGSPFLRKPFNAETLVRMVREIAGKTT